MSSAATEEGADIEIDPPEQRRAHQAEEDQTAAV